MTSIFFTLVQLDQHWYVCLEQHTLPIYIDIIASDIIVIIVIITIAIVWFTTVIMFCCDTITTSYIFINIDVSTIIIVLHNRLR